MVKNAFSKNSIICKVFFKKVVKLFIYYQIFSFKAIYILMQLLNYCFIEKQKGKKDLIGLVNLSSFKMILILCREPIAI